MPDMVLASIEIGRRGYEYSSQYIEKTKNKKKKLTENKKNKLNKQ